MGCYDYIYSFGCCWALLSLCVIFVFYLESKKENKDKFVNYNYNFKKKQELCQQVQIELEYEKLINFGKKMFMILYDNIRK